MLDEVKRKLRRLVRGKPPPKKRYDDARIPEGPQPGGPERPDEAPEVRPPAEGEEGYAVPVSRKEKLHDGYTGIRPRRPGEDTDMGRDLVPDITMPGRDLLPPKDDDDEEQRGG